MATSKDLVRIVNEGDNRELTLKDLGELKSVLNQEPNKSWVKNHPIARDVKYLPIDKVETMLDIIFVQWRVEVLNISQLAQSICCTIRLHYKNPISKEWDFQDGVGAVPLKTDKGASAADLSKIKNDAVTTGAPAAKSYAIKDAAEHLGKIFGRDLNRKDVIAYNNIYAEELEPVNWSKEMAQAKTLDDLRKIWNKMPKEEQAKEEMVKLKEAMKISLEEEN